MIDKAEIERIIDDLETKSKQKVEKYNASEDTFHIAYAFGMYYAIDRLKELL